MRHRGGIGRETLSSGGVASQHEVPASPEAEVTSTRMAIGSTHAGRWSATRIHLAQAAIPQQAPCTAMTTMWHVVRWRHLCTASPAGLSMQTPLMGWRQLHFLRFRGLNLDRVRFPVTSDHFVIKNYRCVIECALARLQADESTAARHIRSALEHRQKTIARSQQVGVFNVDDLSIAGGAEQGKPALDLLSHCESLCDEQGRTTEET